MHPDGPRRLDLPDRLQFDQRLSGAVAVLETAVLLVHLGGFEAVNDQLGIRRRRGREGSDAGRPTVAGHG